MSEKSTIISSENTQTVVAVCFVLALLAVAFNFYNYVRIQQLVQVTGKIYAGSLEQDIVSSERLKAFSDLEKRVSAMEAAPAPIAAPVEAPAEEPAAE
jgi:hypothetical protein